MNSDMRFNQSIREKNSEKLQTYNVPMFHRNPHSAYSKGVKTNWNVIQIVCGIHLNCNMYLVPRTPNEIPFFVCFLNFHYKTAFCFAWKSCSISKLYDIPFVRFCLRLGYGTTTNWSANHFNMVNNAKSSNKNRIEFQVMTQWIFSLCVHRVVHTAVI